MNKDIKSACVSKHSRTVFSYIRDIFADLCVIKFNSPLCKSSWAGLFNILEESKAINQFSPELLFSTYEINVYMFKDYKLVIGYKLYLITSRIK